MPKEAGLTANQRRFVGAMLTHKTAVEAATVAGLGERTARRYMANPAVREALAEAQDGLLREATQRAVASLSLALATLQDIAIDEATPPGVRVAACKVLLEHGRNLHQEVTLLERVERIEEALKERKT